MLRERWVQAFVLWLGVLAVVGEGSVLASPTNLAVTSYADLVRFTAQGDVKELRVEVFTLAGQKIVDSGIIKGSALDWRLGDQKGHLVASGVYLYAVTVKDGSGKLSKHLGKLAVVQGRIGLSQAPGLSLPTVGILAICRIDCEPPTPRWQELLDDAGSDNFRLLRLSQTLLTLDNVGRLSVPQLCLSGDCRSTWPGAGASGWVDDGAIVRLVTDTDNVGIGTPTPTEKLSVVGNISATGAIDSVGQMSKIRFHYNTLAELPDPSVYHGMFAHVHATAKAYLAHAGAWVPLANEVHMHTLSDIANQDCGAGNAIRGWTGGVLNCVSVGGAGSGWSLTGDAGTNPATNFLGTTDNQSLEIRVNNERSLLIVPTAGAPSVIGGSHLNSVSDGIVGATVFGGGATSTACFGLIYCPNSVSGSFGTISGGSSNAANNSYSTVGGGHANLSNGEGSTVAGGEFNQAGYGNAATVGGGSGNKAIPSYSTVGGGASNRAFGAFATVSGGQNNYADGEHSFAAGRNAKANHQGSFAWADCSPCVENQPGPDFVSVADNEFAARATGGVRFVTACDCGITGTGDVTAGVQLASGGGSWSSISDRNTKANFTFVDGRGILTKLAQIPITTWNYKSQNSSIRHIGPMAQDFYMAFGLGEDDKHITTIDADGIALISIQALYELSLEKDKKIEAQAQEIAALQTRLETLEKEMQALKAQVKK